MTNNSLLSWVAILSAIAAPAFGGDSVAASKSCDASKILEKSIVETDLCRYEGQVTLGGKFGEDVTAGYIDFLIPLFQGPNDLLFFDARVNGNDSSQEVYSFGLGYRHLFPDVEMILGANAFYDYVDSPYDFHYDQAGFGVEVLTRWVDARFNYYLPADDINVISSHRSTETHFGGDTKTTVSRLFERREAALEGFYTELGFLTPGLDRYFELRWFGGYYFYNNPFGGDFEGFKARMEARLTRAITLDAEYWSDDHLAGGGNWMGGVRVSLPFEIGNIFQGRNPFEGACEYFKFGRREFKTRMTDMVWRSHVPQTVASAEVEDRSERRVKEEETQVRTPTAEGSTGGSTGASLTLGGISNNGSIGGGGDVLRIGDGGLVINNATWGDRDSLSFITTIGSGDPLLGERP